MDKATFIRRLDRRAIENAITRAEALTSGEIRVAIKHEPSGNPLATAREVFLRMNMIKTQERNAVLILVAPSSQTFAVIGDEGVHQKCGDNFWRELTVTMAACFKQGDFTNGLKQGIERAGALLATHFPRQPNDKNELSNQVIDA